MKIYNNTQYIWYSTTHTGLTFLASHNTTTGSLDVFNNILSTGDTNAFCEMVNFDGAGTNTFDYNLIYAPNGAPLSSPNVGAHGINNSDPKFVSTTVGAATAFRLQSSIPARNAGTSIPVYQDPADTIRPTGAAWDMGAWEYYP